MSDDHPQPPMLSPDAKPTWPVLSPLLREFIERNEPRLIAEDLGLLAEARVALPALRACADHPSGQEGVRHVVGRRFVIYPQPERLDWEWSAWWADYFEALEDVPLVALTAAMATWVKRAESQFLPKPGELRAIALDSVTREGLACDTIMRAERIEGNRHRRPDPEPEAPLISPEERERVKAMVADYLAKAKARLPPPVVMRPNQGEVDGGGLTAEMRRLMARQFPT